MSRDLREWIVQMEKWLPEEFRRTSRLIDPAGFECSALLEYFERQSQYPTVFFENVLDNEGKATAFRLLMNAFATTPKIAAALGLQGAGRREVMEQYNRGQASPRDPVKVARAKAPVKEVVRTGRKVNLKKLPVPRINEMDGGAYLSPIIVSRHPQTGRYNVSWNRCMVIDETHLGIWMSPRHLWSYFMTSEELGRSLPVAVVLGHHPAFFLVGAGLTKLDQDEYRVAGGVMGESLRVVESETLGDGLLVPADAEIVLEGEIVADKRTIEGPFGEFTGYEGPQRLSWLVEVKAVTARKDGIIVGVFGAHQDNLNAHYPIMADIFANLRVTMPNVVDLSWVDSGAPLSMVIAMQKKSEGEPLRAALNAFAQSNFLKHITVVDDDIDPGDLRQVGWAVATRVQADRAVNILKGMQGQVLDPSLEHEIRGAGMVIDATRPLDRPYSIKATPPGDIVEKVVPGKYFQGDKKKQ
jgi:2,5-furandicarboxylate decarboxylase 1